MLFLTQNYRSIHFEKIKKPHSCSLKMSEDTKQSVHQVLRLMEFMHGEWGRRQGSLIRWAKVSCGHLLHAGIRPQRPG